MINNFKNWLHKVTAPPSPPETKKKKIYNYRYDPFNPPSTIARNQLNESFQKTSDVFKNVFKANNFAMDGLQAAMDSSGIKAEFVNGQQNISNALTGWYNSQGFIGWQLAAIMAQHWLIDKCCYMPAQDAIRRGFDTTVNSGDEVDTDVLDAIREADTRYNLNKNLVEFVHLGRVFGIRLALFVIENDFDDKDFYEKPFNPDGITPGSYKGISQIDPYWVAPELDFESAANPASKHFYEPTWWRIGGRRIHRTHLIIFRHREVGDILKPGYIYGGVPVPQQIFEHVYNAERTANEAPMLAMTKRMNILKTDSAEALAQEGKFAEKMQLWSAIMNNYGIKVIDKESEDMTQFDTSLADLDTVIMTQYQLVAAAANVPATKLLGTSPKGFNATGSSEESNYHEELESIQTMHMTPLIERHHLLLIHSEIAPKFNIPVFDTKVVWNALDAMTAKEKAEINLVKAQTSALLAQLGAIDGHDERQRIINDPDSNYSGLDEEKEPSELGAPYEDLSIEEVQKEIEQKDGGSLWPEGEEEDNNYSDMLGDNYPNSDLPKQKIPVGLVSNTEEPT